MWEVSPAVVSSLLENDVKDFFVSLQLFAREFLIKYLQSKNWDFEDLNVYYGVFLQDVRLGSVEIILFLNILLFLIYNALNVLNKQLYQIINILSYFACLVLLFISPFINCGEFFNEFFFTTKSGGIFQLVVLLFSLILLVEIFKTIENKVNIKVEFFFLVNCLVGGLLSLIVVNDFFLTYIFFELMSFTVCLLFLITVDKQVRVEASIKYFILNGVASVFFCLACVFIFLKTGGLHFNELVSTHEGILIQYSVIFITLSFLGKFGTVPFSV
jgi:NADH-quinone oxidoreductase subunit N